jgi:hypothetical protein
MKCLPSSLRLVATLGCLASSYGADLGSSITAGGSRTAGEVTLTDEIAAVALPMASGSAQVTGGWLGLVTGLHAPTMTLTPRSVAAGATVTGTIVTNDADGDAVTIQVRSLPQRGTFTLSQGQNYTYTAAAESGGVDAIALRAVDGNGNQTDGFLTITVQANQSVVRAFLPGISAPYALRAGTPVSVAVIGGRPPLRWSTTNGRAVATGSLNGLDVDGDGQLDVGLIGRLEPASEGSGLLTITDALGVATSVAFTVAAEPPPAPAKPAPPVPTSSRTQTLFGALGPQTRQGVASLRSVFGSLSQTQAVAYAWDATTQTFVTLPSEPTGGLSAGSGIFVASRVDLPVDFSGSPATAPYAWELQPGWNFVAIPAMVDASGDSLSTFDPTQDLMLAEAGGTELLGEDRLLVFSGNWWSFDGQNYEIATTLVPGRAYWVRNRSTEPSRPVVLQLAPGIGPRVMSRSAEGSRPPVPPTSAQSSQGSAGGCGLGGGLAVLLGGLALMRRRR